MRCVVLVVTSAMVAAAYFDPATFALLFGLLAYHRLGDWAAATRFRSRRHWAAHRYMRALARRDDPGPWAEPVLLTAAPPAGNEREYAKRPKWMDRPSAFVEEPAVLCGTGCNDDFVCPPPTPPGKVRVDVEEAMAVVESRAAINAPDPVDVEWYEGGRRLEIPADTLRRFRRTGLSNVDFVAYGFHKTWEDGLAAATPPPPGGHS